MARPARSITSPSGTPSLVSFPRATLEDLRGDPLAVAHAVLAGEHGAWRDIVLVSAAAALVTAGTAPRWREGMAQAMASIDSGAARAKLEALRAV
jgi:anthranilate phosphoribosyltransferase